VRPADRGWTLAVVCAATALLLLDVTVVNVALPAIEDDLGASFSELQWVIDAYALTLAVTLLSAGSLADPVRLQLVDVLRKHAGKVCVCELVPLFELSQPTVSHHLKVLREAGIVGSERRGLWAYYYVEPEALEGLSTWLSQ